MLSKIFTTLCKVERREIAAFLWSFAYFFCLLAGYYILRPVREAMAIQSGVQNLPWLMTATFVGMLLITPLFGFLSARFPRKQLLPIIYFFFVANLIAFFSAFQAELSLLLTARFFYVWLSVFNLFVVSVFWSFMADLFNNEQAKRLFSVIAAGGSSGALLGPTLTASMVKITGVPSLMLLSAGFLLCAVLCIYRLGKWAHQQPNAARNEQALGGSMWAGVVITSRSPYLLGIACYIFILTWTSALLYLEQSRIVESAIATTTERTRFYAEIDLLVNACTFVAQLFITQRLIERFGLVSALLFLPAASIFGFALLGTGPGLDWLVAFIVIRRAGEYGISKPAREVLFTVVDREQKYKAKNFIDTAITRGGDAVSGWLVNGIKALGVTGTSLAWFAVPIAALWVMVGWMLARKQEQLKLSGIKQND